MWCCQRCTFSLGDLIEREREKMSKLARLKRQKKSIEMRKWNYELVSSWCSRLSYRPPPNETAMCALRVFSASPQESQFSASTHQPSHVSHYLSFFILLNDNATDCDDVEVVGIAHEYDYAIYWRFPCHRRHSWQLAVKWWRKSATTRAHSIDIILESAYAKQRHKLVVRRELIE